MKGGFVLEAVVTPGNVRDCVVFNDVYDGCYNCIICLEHQVLDYRTTNIKSFLCLQSIANFGIM